LPVSTPTVALIGGIAGLPVLPNVRQLSGVVLEWRWGSIGSWDP
jgi:hypothetical protein